LPVSYVSVSAPDVFVRRTGCANSAAIFAGIKRRLASFTAPDSVVNGLVAESRAQFATNAAISGTEYRHLPEMPDSLPGNVRINGSVAARGP
jgi:hypothetical protein